jgi:hypothetical protein
VSTTLDDKIIQIINTKNIKRRQKTSKDMAFNLHRDGIAGPAWVAFDQLEIRRVGTALVTPKMPLATFVLAEKRSLRSSNSAKFWCEKLRETLRN